MRGGGAGGGGGGGGGIVGDRINIEATVGRESLAHVG